ncbi:MAG: glycosyltransferase family 2 protein [Prolixibacteraceae bacterium]|nr:glycosyltransferase family 2 protein [Prolixibacteraceae bacterium]
MKASIIICSYNEGKTIADVVMACCKFNPECEIIVVDDGSTDNTENILNELSANYSFRYERLEKNMGKSFAMVHGVKMSENEIILFFDGDVSNIIKEHFEMLLNPIINGSADMVLGQPSETLIDYKINPFKSLTGERAMLKKDIMPILNEIKDIRFGVETFLNLYFQAQGKRINYALLKGLKHPSTYEKSGSVNIATKKYIIEGKEIAITVMNNQDLITQRVKLLMKKSNTSARKKMNSLQADMNKKLQDFKNKLDKFLKE